LLFTDDYATHPQDKSIVRNIKFVCCLPKGTSLVPSTRTGWKWLDGGKDVDLIVTHLQTCPMWHFEHAQELRYDCEGGSSSRVEEEGDYHGL
jgi:hypothetical protein